MMLDFQVSTFDWDDSMIFSQMKRRSTNNTFGNLSMMNSGLSVELLDSTGGIISSTPMQHSEALSQVNNGVVEHSTVIPWDSDAASYEVVKDGVVIDSGSLVAPDASTLTIAGDLRSEFQHGERIQLQIEDSTNGIDYDLNDPYCTGDGNGFNSFTDQANDESGWTATQNTFETYDIYTSLNGGENWQLRSKGQHSPCIDIETTKSMVTENFMVKVVADDGLHTREAISNEIAITGSVHWLSWMSSEEALPGDQIMMEIESRQMPTDGCNYSISTPGWTLENPIENSDTNYSATQTFTVQAPEDAYSGINKLSIDATCGNNTQEIPVKVRVRGGKDMPKSTAPMVVELAPPPGYNSEEDFSDWEIPDFRNGTFMIDTDEDGIPDRFDECVTTPSGFEINDTGCAVPSTVSGEDGGDGTDSATDNSGDVSTQGELVEGYDLIYLLGALILGVILGVAVVSMKGDEEDE